MTHPTAYSSKASIPLPSDETIRRTIGATYDSKTELNVIKMMAGTENMYAATVGW